MAVTLPTKLSLRTRMFTGGDFVDAVSGRTYEVENPANGQVIAEVAEGGAEDVDRAVDAARRAAPGWAATAPADRKKVLQRFADLIDANSEELARIETLDVGKPISDTRSLDIPDSAATIRWHAEATDKLYDQVAPTGPGAVAMVVREPLGVVGAIVPWNYPLQMAAWKLGPILATGNAVVMKPAQVTSLSLLRVAELGAEAGLPDGVLNVVTGPGSVVGTAIARHPGIDGVAFTGSTEVGRDGPRVLGRRRTSSGSRSSSVARARRSSWPMRRTWTGSRIASPTRSSGTWARTARPAAGS